MKRKSIKQIGLIVTTFLFVFIIYTTYSNADDFNWPRWRGPNGDGISAETDWNPKALAGGQKYSGKLMLDSVIQMLLLKIIYSTQWV